MADKYFNREFLANPDDENDSSFVITRVLSTDEFFMASLLLNDGFGEAKINTYLFLDDSADSVAYAEEKGIKLRKIFDNFMKAYDKHIAEFKKKVTNKQKDNS